MRSRFVECDGRDGVEVGHDRLHDVEDDGLQVKVEGLIADVGAVVAQTDK